MKKNAVAFVVEDELEERFEESDSDRLEERFEADMEQLEDTFDDLADRLDDQLDGIEDRIESQLENILEPMFDDGVMLLSLNSSQLNTNQLHSPRHV